MTNDTTILKSDFGSLFSVFSDKELEEINKNSDRNVLVCGEINNPGIMEIPEDATLKDIVDLTGGFIGDTKFKACQIGIPFGPLLTEDSFNKPLDFNLFSKKSYKTLIILSNNDCIVQYGKFYIDYLLSKISTEDENTYNDICKMSKILDLISKGLGNMRDVYFLRELAEKSTNKYGVILDIIKNFYEELEEHIEDKKCYTSQCNHLTKLTITKKCIGCGACARTCPVDCISGELRKQHDIDYERCTHCGACVSVCPVDAINYGDNTIKFLRDLATPNKIVITQMAPAVRVALGEAFGFDAGDNVQNKIAEALRIIGVDYVFDTTWAADLTIMEEAAEFQERLEKYLAGDKDVKLPILTSCCPAWVKFIEQNYGDMLDVPSTAKSPMEMFAAVAKDLWAKSKGLSRDEVISVAIMPCIAKKYEASRPEFSKDLNYDVDYVITTRELIKLFKDSNIDLQKLEGEEIDKVMGEYSGAGIIFGRTGGVIEAAVRTAVENITGETLDDVNFECLRGWDNFRSCTVKCGDIDLKIGVTYGLREAGKMLDKIRSGEEFYHAIEIMACMGGCVGGGGQPKARKRVEVLQERVKGLDNIDESLNIRQSHKNPEAVAIYKKYLDHPLSHKAHEILHTRYFIRQKKYKD